MTEEIRCAYCGESKKYPDDFACSYYAKCIVCCEEDISWLHKVLKKLGWIK